MTGKENEAETLGNYLRIPLKTKFHSFMILDPTLSIGSDFDSRKLKVSNSEAAFPPSKKSKKNKCCDMMLDSSNSVIICIAPALHLIYDRGREFCEEVVSSLAGEQEGVGAGRKERRIGRERLAKVWSKE